VAALSGTAGEQARSSRAHRPRTRCLYHRGFAHHAASLLARGLAARISKVTASAYGAHVSVFGILSWPVFAVRMYVWQRNALRVGDIVCARYAAPFMARMVDGVPVTRFIRGYNA